MKKLCDGVCHAIPCHAISSISHTHSASLLSLRLQPLEESMHDEAVLCCFYSHHSHPSLSLGQSNQLNSTQINSIHNIIFLFISKLTTSYRIPTTTVVVLVSCTFHNNTSHHITGGLTWLEWKRRQWEWVVPYYCFLFSSFRIIHPSCFIAHTNCCWRCCCGCYCYCSCSDLVLDGLDHPLLFVFLILLFLLLFLSRSYILNYHCRCRCCCLSVPVPVPVPDIPAGPSFLSNRSCCCWHNSEVVSSCCFLFSLFVVSIPVRLFSVFTPPNIFTQTVVLSLCIFGLSDCWCDDVLYVQCTVS